MKTVVTSYAYRYDVNDANDKLGTNSNSNSKVKRSVVKSRTQLDYYLYDWVIRMRSDLKFF